LFEIVLAINQRGIQLLNMNSNNVAETYRGIEITKGAGFATGTFSVYLINCMSVFTIESARNAIDNAHDKAKQEGRWLAGPKPIWIA
jgi:hypothetical protein